jgi:hypothetical protein
LDSLMASAFLMATEFLTATDVDMVTGTVTAVMTDPWSIRSHGPIVVADTLNARARN